MKPTEAKRRNHPQWPGNAAPTLCQIVGKSRQIAEDAAGPINHHLPFGCQPQTARAPIDETQLQSCLKQSQTLRHGGRGYIQRPRCRGKRRGSGDGLDQAQFGKVDHIG